MLQQLEQMGIQPSAVHCNLSQDEWREQELKRNEGRLSDNGTVIVDTGIYTPSTEYFHQKEFLFGSFE